MGSDFDLDALLAIVRRRTPGIWETGGPYPSTSVIVCVDGGSGWPTPEPSMYDLVAMLDGETEGEPHPQAQADAAAIVAAVNHFETIAERCKRAEEWNDYDSTIAELTRQSDELQNRCGELWELLHEASAFVPNDVEMVLFDQIQVALDKGAFVKGGADDKA